ncbi:hypothetical protein CAEBREN_01923 [Caenorhabditis brenneri]|uniref:Uncharacterized protein n=1 Tax=Caenorhabditis brenneri TaxID=135651 RepID=G0MTC5_CAEBE|nr:hypothetical protein CAEBREN_01923 [Caenorhabditis brenneri]
MGFPDSHLGLSFLDLCVVCPRANPYKRLSYLIGLLLDYNMKPFIISLEESFSFSRHRLLVVRSPTNTF